MFDTFTDIIFWEDEIYNKYLKNIPISKLVPLAGHISDDIIMQSGIKDYFEIYYSFYDIETKIDSYLFNKYTFNKKGWPKFLILSTKSINFKNPGYNKHLLIK